MHSRLVSKAREFIPGETAVHHLPEIAHAFSPCFESAGVHHLPEIARMNLPFSPMFPKYGSLLGETVKHNKSNINLDPSQVSYQGN